MNCKEAQQIMYMYERTNEWMNELKQQEYYVSLKDTKHSIYKKNYSMNALCTVLTLSDWKNYSMNALCTVLTLSDWKNYSMNALCTVLTLSDWKKHSMNALSAVLMLSAWQSWPVSMSSYPTEQRDLKCRSLRVKSAFSVTLRRIRSMQRLQTPNGVRVKGWTVHSDRK